MGANDGYLRSTVDKSESGSPENLRLRSADDKIGAEIAKGFADTVSGADVMTNPYRAMGFADTIGGADAFAIVYKALGFADTTSGADVFTLLRFLDMADVGSGADVFSIDWKAFAVADSGSGSDSFVMDYREVFMVDTGAGADVFPTIVWKGMFITDSGAGVDVFTLLRSLDFTDSVSGAEVITLTRPMFMSDVGSGSDAFSIPFKELPVTDVGSGSDDFDIVYKALGFTDSGTGSDAFEVTIYRTFTDSGAGVDVWTLTKPKFFSDSAGGVDAFKTAYREMEFIDSISGDDVFTIPFKAMGFVDTVSGADIFFLLAEKAFVDAGSGSDAFTIPLRLLYVVDTGTGAEVFSIPLKGLGFSDVGAGVDVFTPLRFLDFVDAGAGSDAFSLLRMLGISDVGDGSDVFTTPFREMGVTDLGDGVDVFATPLKMMGFLDTVAGADVFTLYTGVIVKFVVDTGSGSDVFSVLKEMGFVDSILGSDVFSSILLIEKDMVDVGTGVDVFINHLRIFHYIPDYEGIVLVSLTEADKDDIVNRVWDAIIADHLIPGTTGKKLYDGGTGDAAVIAAAVWDFVLYPDHINDDTAGKYIYEFYRLVEAGDVYVSTSTSSEILMVRDRLGDAGVLITETVIDEEAISTDADTVFPAERLLYEINGVWLSTDTPHAGSNYYEGANGEFDTYTGKIVLHTSLPGDNTEVLLNYTFMRGLPDNVIDQFLVEAKLYVKKYTRKDYVWADGLGATPDEETQIALLAACSLAAMRCLEAIATGDILQFGYNFRLGDLQVESMTSGGFHVQAHIDFLKGDVERKLAMLGRSMYFVARTTKRWGRGAHGYKRYPGGTRGVY